MPANLAKYSRKKRSYFSILLFFVMLPLLLFQFSCGTGEVPAVQDREESSAEEHSSSTAEKNEEESKDNTIEEAEKEEVSEEKQATELDFEKIKPNELGDFMVLMYHEIGSPESEWRRTPDNFRRDLELLYEKGYRAVNLSDIVNGNIDIPAGTSPVVLTFDDATKGQFNYLEDNDGKKIDPDCAVAIMEEFYKENPDFGLAATFYIYYPNPFRQQEYIEEKLNYLVDKGFEIGNHTYGHANLSRIGSGKVQQELAYHVRETQKYVPNYQVRSLALPYGAYPQDNPGLALKGSYEDISYHNEAVLLVGANPAPSPFHENFDPSRLPRIRASEMKTEGVGLYDWLEYFEDNPHRKYVSDGDPGYISAPKATKEYLEEDNINNKEVRFYEIESESEKEEN